MSRIGITNHFVNTIITALQAPEWETLLQRSVIQCLARRILSLFLFYRIGIDAMYHLLTDTTIFISLPNDNLCQLTGDPILYMALPDRLPKKTDLQKEVCVKRTATGSHEDEPPKKRLRKCDSAMSRSNSSIANGGNASTTTPRSVQKSPYLIHQINSTLSIATLPQTLLWLERGYSIRDQFAFHVPTCLPSVYHQDVCITFASFTQSAFSLGHLPDILNVLNPSFQKKPKVAPEDYVDPDPKKQAADSRRLSKYVFPRQYKLSSPFNPGNMPRGFAFKFPDYTDREDEIKARFLGFAKYK
jgi:telomerase reverse transcriptase